MHWKNEKITRAHNSHWKAISSQFQTFDCFHRYQGNKSPISTAILFHSMLLRF